MLTVRALTFAFEDREQIAKIILEIWTRLSAATGGVASDKCLWENITAFMTYGNGSQAMGRKFMMHVKNTLFQWRWKGNSAMEKLFLDM